MNSGRDPLTQEERALAARLARLGVPEGPPPALDAKILAAAHGAVQRVSAPRRRWPLAVGAAASVVFAVGIAWQLRPGQDETRVYSEADFVRAPGARGPNAAEELPMATDSAAPVAQAVAPAPGETPAETARVSTQEMQDASAEATQQSARADAVREAPAQEQTRNAFPAEAKAVAAPPSPPAPPAPPEPPIVFDAPAPLPPPPPAPAAAAAAGASRETAAPQRRAEQEAAADAAAVEQITVTGARVRRDAEGFSDDELDEDPPATADSPQVQRAWLQRIREMVAGGDLDGARASLGEFKRRYPRYALPDDLRELAP